MFEKSLYDLIRGLRSHRGTEHDYIQGSLRECIAEIKSRDMDRKTTALLKLIYLEMFGYDMSWASFYALEVMSSTKFLQKRVGYLAAVQSFRQDTEVLMLATNLLKKDIVSPGVPQISLPLTAVPHIITPSLAMSLFAEISSRISHPHAVIRKKAVISLYRLALVYPEALKLAWPRIKDRLVDEQEDTSVTTAVVNVACELGWRRPMDLLPLAPRLFDLLVGSGNNWMAIKILKLFATLTPIEPRLTRKVLRPLSTIIQTTTAMSLLYECINAIVQGGVLDGDDTSQEKDTVARLCVEKLRAMIVTEPDPNLKYVALLAFNRIVASQHDLVSMQQDVIMDCLEDADMSIRLLALELSAKLVNGDSLRPMVDRLITQLHGSSALDPGDVSGEAGNLGLSLPLEPGGPRKGQDATHHPEGVPLALSFSYRVEALHRILDLCSRNNYSDIPDFEWFVDVLVQLIRLLPPNSGHHLPQSTSHHDSFRTDLASRIGSEIRNVAIRVKDVRIKATRVAESLVSAGNRGTWFPTGPASGEILGPLAWLLGEYAGSLLCPSRALDSLIDVSNVDLPARTLSLYIQAIPKVFSHVVSSHRPWTSVSGGDASLSLGRIIEFLAALASHPDLDVQERAIELLEISRLFADAVRPGTCQAEEMPFLLSSVLPSLFSGLELNPVAASAQRRVPMPHGLWLETAFNNAIPMLLDSSTDLPRRPETGNPIDSFYHLRGASVSDTPSAEISLAGPQSNTAYQNPAGLSDDVNVAGRQKLKQRVRDQDDPFYIGTAGEQPRSSGRLDYTSDALMGKDIDINSIPVVDLRIGDQSDRHMNLPGVYETQGGEEAGPRRYEVISDETINFEPAARSSTPLDGGKELGKARRPILRVDSSNLGVLPSESSVASQDVSDGNGNDEMARAIHKMEKARLKIQRASERIDSAGIPTGGMPVKKKRAKKRLPRDI